MNPSFGIWPSVLQSGKTEEKEAGLLHQSRERGHCCRGNHRNQQRSTPPDTERGRHEPERPFIDDDAATRGKGAGDDKRRQQRRCERGDEREHPKRQFPATGHYRACRLECHGGCTNDEDCHPWVAHRRHHPAKHASDAATIGTPALVNGTSKRAMPAPASAATAPSRLLSCETSNTKKRAGKAASSP